MSKLIYFLCTGNSCRSQMAEGLAKQIMGNKFQIESAGVEAHGVNPRAIEMMKEINIDITNQTSDILSQEILNKADYVITLCGSAKDRCPPLFNLRAEHQHWDLEDPAQASGTEEEIRDFFRKVRDDIKRRVELLRSQMDSE